MRKLLLLSLGLLLLSMQLFAQSRIVTGRVTDDKGVGVNGASVTIKETNEGTSTNPDGSFSLQVPEGARTLVVSSVGFENREFVLGATGNNVTIVLGAAARSLDEVVVVA